MVILVILPVLTVRYYLIEYGNFTIFGNITKIGYKLLNKRNPYLEKPKYGRNPNNGI